MLGRFFKKLFGPPRKSRPATVEDVPAASVHAEPFQPAPATATPEELCGLRDGMTREELREQLAMLYRRHNRAASSLNPALRAEAERMLDAIVEVRQRYLDDSRAA